MFTGEFSIAAASGFNVFTLTDTSDYTDEPENTFTGRTITLTTSSGGTLVPAGTLTTYIDFPFSGGASITIDCMERDYALIVTVEWISDDPQPGSIYESSLVYGFESYDKNGEYGVIQALIARPSIVQNLTYWLNLGKLQTFIHCANQAVYYQQQDSAQAALNRGAYLLNTNLTSF